MTSNTSTMNQNQYNNTNMGGNKNLQFDPNFGKSINVSMQSNNNYVNNNNNFQPTQIEEQPTLKVDNPYASIDFNSKTNMNTGNNNNFTNSIYFYL